MWQRFAQLWLSISLQRLSVVTVGQSLVSDGWLLCLNLPTRFGVTYNWWWRDLRQLWLSTCLQWLSGMTVRSWCPLHLICYKWLLTPHGKEPPVWRVTSFTLPDMTWPWWTVAIWSSLVFPLVWCLYQSVILCWFFVMTDLLKKKISQTVTGGQVVRAWANL